jgi:type I restriction enzyme S subunit
MTVDLRPYPIYKESGLPWLGRIPAHWEIGRNGRMFEQRNQNGFSDLPILEVSLKTGVQVRDMGNLKRKQVIADRDKYKRAVKGDIAYNMMRMWQGAVGVAPVDGLVSPAYVVARPYSEIEPRYFAYLFRTKGYMNEVDGYSRGIVKDRNRLYWQDFKRIPTCIPPYKEQKAIADYIDANAMKVRRFIRNRRRLINVLNEQKQAIINRAVTRGLDPNVPLKPSGIDWLGDIPEHWEKHRLKFLVRNVKEQTSTRHPDEVYVALEHVEGWSGRIALPSEDIEFGSQVKRFHIGDVLFGKLRPYLAKVTRPSVPGVCVGEFLVLRGKDKALLPEFLEQELRSKIFIDIVNSATFGAKMPRADWTFIGNLPIIYPPTHAEQLEILAEIRRQTASLQTTIDKAQREIDLIREYRTHLISDVVTGKMDVRHLVPSPGGEDLEERAEALEPLEEDIAADMIDDEEPSNEAD